MSSWYDEYKEAKCLIHTGDKHNKFWIAETDVNTHEVSVRWGRLGTKGQNQKKSFDSPVAAANFVDNKIREKKRKGYEFTDKPKLDRLATEAAIVGTANKCGELSWIETHDEGNGPTGAFGSGVLVTADEHVCFSFINEDRLADPSCSPGILVSLTTRKEIDGRHEFDLVFTESGSYVFEDRSRSGRAAVIDDGHPLHNLVEKVQESLGSSLE